MNENGPLQLRNNPGLSERNGKGEPGKGAGHVSPGKDFKNGGLAGRRIAVVGLGVSNLALARFLVSEGADITLLDQKTLDQMGDRADEVLRLVEGGAHLKLGPGYLYGLWEFQEAYITPGMKKFLPEIERARSAGTRISAEANVFLEYTKAHTIGITGSAGKTTTTTIIGETLSQAGKETYVGGNIGRPLIEIVRDIPKEAFVVLELSSFQLELMEECPGTAILLNIMLDHMDMHRNREEYVAAKKRIFSFQGEDDLAIFNADNPSSASLAALAPGRVAYFSRNSEPAGDGAFLRGSKAFVRLQGFEQEVFDTRRLLIPGPHNVENALAASVCLIDTGVPAALIGDALSRFRGVEHRIEFIRELHGVKYYNDSIATTPDRTKAALCALNTPIILIAGGSDKNLPFDSLGETILERVHYLIITGHTAGKIEEAVRLAEANEGGREKVTIRRCHDLEEALATAYKLATPGSNVILSPASASFDAFSDYKQRGRVFKEMVRGLN